MHNIAEDKYNQQGRRWHAQYTEDKYINIAEDEHAQYRAEDEMNNIAEDKYNQQGKGLACTIWQKMNMHTMEEDEYEQQGSRCTVGKPSSMGGKQPNISR